VAGAHRPGRPAWLELTVAEPLQASEFYAAVMGWEYVVRGSRLVATRDGVDLAAVRGIADDREAAWRVHFHVDDLDDALMRAKSAGATLLEEPGHDDLGRSAWLRDPAHLEFGLWDGPLMGYHAFRPGVWHWVDLCADDPWQAMQFYLDVLGLIPRHVLLGDRATPYLGFVLDGLLQTGSLPTVMEGQRPRWIAYVAVADVDAAYAAAVSLGATVLAAPFDLGGIARMAYLIDPWGAEVGLMDPQRNPAYAVLPE
jgi:predicted enzyme related to lactoylglutathione lyase